MMVQLPIVVELCDAIPPFLGVVQQRILRGRLRTADPHCRYCGRRVSRRSATLDHIKPISHGGLTVAENLALSCTACNRLKADQSLADWLALLETAAERVRRMVGMTAAAG